MEAVYKAEVLYTSNGTPYLREPGLVLIAQTRTDLGGVASFLEGAGFGTDYLQDPTQIPDGTGVCKFAGQLCYLSLGEKRTKNSDAAKYFKNILESGHFSVLEHATYSFFMYGVSRSLTHELVRHRHLSPSQVSQRYCDTPRFVERPEFQHSNFLHEAFEGRIDRTADEYRWLLANLHAPEAAGGAGRTAARKATRQAARACLTNETEAPLVMSGNARAWRHFLDLRMSEHAEPEIRRLAHRACAALQEVDPELFQGYSPDFAW